MRLITFPLLLSLVYAQLVDEDRLSTGECKDAGFHSDTLKCSSCHMLGQYQLEEIMTDCLRCCAESKEAHEKYPMAEFEYCECNLHRFPQISAFIKSDMKDQWGAKMKVRHVRGSLPTIVLKDNVGQVQRTMNVERWDTDTITEFLNDWLE